MSGKEYDLPDPNTMFDYNRWVVNDEFKSLPEEEEPEDEVIYLPRPNSYIKDDHLEEFSEFPDPLEYFSKLKRTIIWTVIITSLSCSLLELLIIKFFFKW